MQKLCCVRTRQHPLPVWSQKFVLSSPTHISTNSRPFFGGNCIKDTPSIPLDRLSGSKTQLMTGLSNFVENRGPEISMAIHAPGVKMWPHPLY